MQHILRNIYIFTIPSLCFAVVSCLLPQSALAQALGRVESGELSATLNASSEDTNNFNLRIIKAGGFASEFSASAFSLENPSRLVIDLPNVIIKGGSSDDIHHSLFSGVRVGAHPDKTRIVVDIKNGHSPQNITADIKGGDTVLVNFSFSGIESTEHIGEQVRLEEPSAISRNNVLEDNRSKIISIPENNPKSNPPSSPRKIAVEPLKTPEPKLQNKIEPVDTEETLPEAKHVQIKGLVPVKEPSSKGKIPKFPQQVKTPEVEKTTENISEPIFGTKTSEESENSTIVKSVVFELSKDNQPALMVDLSNINKYALNSKSKSVYELTIDGAKLAGSHLTFPLFPPDNFSNFEVVVPAERKDGVVLKIYVEEGITLSPYLANGKLWIKSQKQ